MEIELNCRNYGKVIIVKDTNVLIEEDIEERIYQKDENGKPDFSKSPVRDVSNKSLYMFYVLLRDIIAERVRPYNSSTLIFDLFEKLPAEVLQKTLNTLKENYDEED